MEVESDDSHFLCTKCAKRLPVMNRAIHEARCGKMKISAPVSHEASSNSSASAPRPVIDVDAPIVLEPTGGNASSSAISATALVSESPLKAMWKCGKCAFLNEISNGNCERCNDAKLSSWSCPTCTYSNIDTRNTCELCNTPKVPSFADLSNDLETEYGGREDVKWECPSCTYRNKATSDRCEMCDEDPEAGEQAPRPAYRDRLIGGDDLEPQYPPLNGNVLSSAALGAFLGSGAAFLSDRSVMEGAIAGAGAGALGGLFLDQLEHGVPSVSHRNVRSSASGALRNQRTQASSSAPATRGRPAGGATQRRQRDWQGSNPPSRYPRVAAPRSRDPRYAHLGPQDDMLMMMMAEMGRFEQMFTQSLGGLNIDNMTYEQLYERFGGPVQRPATSESIDALPTETLASSDNASECAICLDQMKAGDTIQTLPCLHRYHQACSEQWLKQSGKCPVCKHDV